MRMMNIEIIILGTAFGPNFFSASIMLMKPKEEAAKRKHPILIQQQQRQL